MLNRLGHVSRNDRLATILLKWLASPTGLAFRRKYGRWEYEGLLFGTMYSPVDALVFPPPAAPGKDHGRLAAIGFVVTGSFNTTNDKRRRASRNSASFSDAITAAGKTKKGKGLPAQCSHCLGARLYWHSMPLICPSDAFASRRPCRDHRPFPERVLRYVWRLL